jgi:hypothetical protein
MARIILNDLQEDSLISPAEMKKVFGGAGISRLDSGNTALKQTGFAPGIEVMSRCCTCTSDVCDRPADMVSNSALSGRVNVQIEKMSNGVNVMK